MSEPNVIPGDFSRLRKILLQPATRRLQQAEERLDSLEEYSKTAPAAENVSAVLPEAVRISARKSTDLSTTLVPVIESALDESIARNRSRLANALYPILGG